MAVIVNEPPASLPNNVLASLPCALPFVELGDDQTTLLAAVKACKENISFQNLSENDFTPDAMWRDNFALTGTFRTFYGPQAILKAWHATAAYQRPADFSFISDPPVSRVVRLPNGHAWVDVGFTFNTTGEPQAECSGVLSLVPAVGGQWKIWILKTLLEHLQGLPNVDHLAPVRDSEKNGIAANDETVKAGRGESGVNYFDCIVVGGGQGGLAMGGRLKALGISYVVIDKQPLVGDSWNTRYDSAKVHTTREYGVAHLPFDRTFPLPYSRYLTKGELARGYQDWVKKFGINVWQSTELKSGSWDEAQKKWTLKVLDITKQEEKVLSAAHLVMAIGGGGQTPLMPKLPGRNFRGLILHSSQFRSANDWAGLHGVVVGTANTAHDVAEDMVDAKLKSVTMFQRNRTYIFPAEYWAAFSDTVYNDDIPTADADRGVLTGPNVVTRLIFKAIFDTMASAEPERFEALEKVGFKTEAYGDLAYHLLQRMGGHYMDMGNCKNITDGLVNIISDASITRYIPDGLEFDNGTRIPADVVVFSTGFAGNVRTIVRDLLGKDVADSVDDYWDLDGEGELKGAYKPTGHPAFWYTGGPMGHARYFSRHVGLQIKADLVGTPLKVYNQKQ